MSWNKKMHTPESAKGMAGGLRGGDRVVLCHPNAGRSLMWGGAPHRLVRADDIVGVVE